MRRFNVLMLSGLLSFVGSLPSRSAMAQNRATVVGAASFTQVPLQVAPGGIITVFAAGLSPNGVPANAMGTPLPDMLAGISVSVQQSYVSGSLSVPLISVFPVPTCFNQVSVSCGTLT